MTRPPAPPPFDRLHALAQALAAWHAEEDGATAVEYAVMLALILGTIFGTIGAVGGTAGGLFDGAYDEMVAAGIAEEQN